MTNPLLEKVKDKDVSEDVTVAGVGEAALSMFTGMGGALAGTAAGVVHAVKEGDIQEYTPAFNDVSEAVNEVVQYQPRTAGGKAAIGAIESIYSEYVSEPTQKHLVDPNLERDNPLIAAIGLASGEALGMFLPFKAGAALKPVGKVAGSAIKKTGSLAKNRLLQKIEAKNPAAREAMVDVKTGKPVDIPDAPLSDKGASFHALSEFVKITRSPEANPHAGLGAVLKPLFYKPVQILRDWDSPSLKRLADEIYAPTKADKKITRAVGIDLVDSISKSLGKFGTAFDAIVEPFKGRLNTIKNSSGEAITRGLRTGKVQAKYRQTVLDIAEFNKVLLDKYIRPVLPDVGEIVADGGYVPQVWNVPKILKNPRQFQSFLHEKMGYSIEDAAKSTRRIVESEGTPVLYESTGRLVDAADAKAWMGRVRHEGSASTKAFEKKRRIHISDEVMPYAEPWLVNNIGDLMFTYLRNVTKRVEYARRFGPREENLNATVRSAIKELGIENNVMALKALTSDVYGLADALQGKYKPIESFALNKWNRRLANYEIVLHLGLVSLASFPELAAPAIQFGFVPKAYAKGFAHALVEATGAAERVLTGRRTIPKLKAAKALEEMGAISITPLQSIQAARFTSVTSAFSSRFMHATGLELLTDAQRVIAYETLSHITKRNAKYLAKNKPGKKAKFYEDQLRELGVEKDVAVKWVKEGMPERGHAADLIENAKLRGQRWAVTAPTAATKPLLFSDPHYTNVLLFKSFTSVFSNLFMKRALKELYSKETLASRKAGVIGGMVAATTIAYYTQFLRELISGYDTKMSPSQRLMAAFDRAALTGPYTYAYQIINPYRYGYTDSGALRLFNLAGAAVGDAAKVVDIATKPMSKKQRAKEMAKLTPIANITGAGKKAAADVIEEIPGLGMLP